MTSADGCTVHETEIGSSSTCVLITVERYCRLLGRMIGNEPLCLTCIAVIWVVKNNFSKNHYNHAKLIIFVNRVVPVKIYFLLTLLCHFVPGDFSFNLALVSTHVLFLLPWVKHSDDFLCNNCVVTWNSSINIANLRRWHAQLFLHFMLVTGFYPIPSWQYLPDP